MENSDNLIEDVESFHGISCSEFREYIKLASSSLCEHLEYGEISDATAVADYLRRALLQMEYNTEITGRRVEEAKRDLRDRGNGKSNHAPFIFEGNLKYAQQQYEKALEMNEVIKSKKLTYEIKLSTSIAKLEKQLKQTKEEK